MVIGDRAVGGWSVSKKSFRQFVSLAVGHWSLG